MTQLNDIVQFLGQTLDSTGFDDSSLNGLQVESSNSTVSKLAFAVDAGLSVLEEAVKRQCQLLLVHHGIFWGQSEKIEGILGQKIRTLIEGGCSLYASHLPLDAHPIYGNNAQIISLLGAKLGNPMCLSGQKTIGFIGEFDQAISAADFERRLITLTEEKRFLGLKFGKPSIKTFAVVSGGAAFVLEEAFRLGTDAFITGEPKHSIFHQARELEMNAFFAGHYATETFGVRAVAKALQEKFNLAVEFIDQPSLI